MPGEKLAAQAAGKMAKYAAVAGAGVAGALFLMNSCESESGRNAHGETEELALEYVMPGTFDVEVGETAVNASIELEATWGDQVCTPSWLGEKCVGVHKSDDFNAWGSAENEYQVDFVGVGVTTTREDANEDGFPDGAPLPEDEVTVMVDPTSLTLDSNVDLERSKDKVLTVEDGMVVAEDGEELEEPTPIFREDGEVELWGYNAPDGKSNFTKVVNSIGHNLLWEINSDAPINATRVLSVAASDPACDAAARDVFENGLTDLVEISAQQEFVDQGYARENVHIKSETGVWNWPSPEETENSDGETFADRKEALESELADSVDVDAGQDATFTNDIECTSEGVIDTSNKFSAQK